MMLGENDRYENRLSVWLKYGAEMETQEHYNKNIQWSRMSEWGNVNDT